MIYDYIVLGGGISGLYCAHLLLKKFPRASVLILEKYGVVGGRVHTYVDKYMSVEAGAGRFNMAHTLLMELIEELGLSKKIYPISSDASYAPADGSEPKILSGNDVKTKWYIVKVVVASKLESTDLLKSMSFIDYCKRILVKSEIEYIKGSFGYYSELVIMNAYDAINLLGGLGPGNDFGGLKGGLVQIIDRLADRISRRAGSRILCNKTVVDIQYVYKGVGLGSLGSSQPGSGLGSANQHNGGSVIEVYCKENVRPYVGLKCICALPKQVTEKLAIFSPMKDVFAQIVCAPLCRIYSTFPVVRGKTWFSGMPKFTTNNNLRMVIPISEADGVIMISYSDNKYADGWNRLYKSGGIEAVDRELARLMKKSTGIDIPAPLKTVVFHWPCGVGYWGIGADSSQFPLQPDSSVPIYLCGEHYSGEYQQWMEGALETARRVVDKI
jgi:monoamine oxidase